MLLRRIEQTKQNFDARLRVLEFRQNELNVHINMSTLQEITLFEELMLLKDFENREHELEGKVEQKIMERSDLVVKVSSITRKKLNCIIFHWELGGFGSPLLFSCVYI